ncbi:unnamed protein product [Lymnaea stagnalis]|uniref:Small ribosomal subunit protein mS31 n=1 Tax=Lymnaea stagnalis TaxID=6523 RepID=A0AAV2I7K5_LYMST
MNTKNLFTCIFCRQSEVFSDLFGVARLGIFDADKIKAGAQQPVVQVEPDLWQTLDEEKLRTVGSGLPRNAFEEMIQLTKEGKLWQFPIDNEADMHEERKYKFHDHVFLEQHLSLFPDKGPVRKFMELIALGLSLNPYITVPEKLEHIRWYAEYFREKQGILESVVGEQARMKDGEEKKEN